MCFPFFLSERYPDDIYDRTWTPYNNSTDWKQIDTSLTINQGASFNFLPLPPSIVMRTAAIPSNASNNIEFYFLAKCNASTYYVYLYFAEIQKLQENQTREFNIFVNGELLNNDPINPSYLQRLYYVSAVSETRLELWINRTSRSTLPPLLSAIEIYMTKDFLQSQTYQTDGMLLDTLILLSSISINLKLILDPAHHYLHALFLELIPDLLIIFMIIVDAITNVKSIYGIKRNWQGDPCTPLCYLWDGLNCSYAGSDSPRIIYL